MNTPRGPRTEEKGTTHRSLRPVLVASGRIVSEYCLFLRRLLVGLAAESIATALVCPAECDLDAVVAGPVEVVRYPAVALPLIEHAHLGGLVTRLERFKPTVLHCVCERRSLLTRRLARRLDLPYVVTIQSLPGRSRRLSLSPRRCAQVIAAAKTIEQRLTERRPRFCDRLERIEMGTFVENEVRCFAHPSRMPAMVIAREIDNVAHFEPLFGAVRSLVLEGYEFVVLVMGTGKAESSLRRLLGSLDLLQHVVIIPRLNPCRSVLGAGDIYIRPQPSRSFDPLLLEAMSLGTVVASCAGGVDDLVVPDQTAVVFDHRDPLSIRQALQRLLDQRDLARRLARNAQEYVRAHHSVSDMLGAIVQAYQRAQQWYHR